MTQDLFINQFTRRQYILISVFLFLLILVIEMTGIFTPLRAMGEYLLTPVGNASAEVIRLLNLPYHAVRTSFEEYTRVQDLELRYAEAIAQLGEMESLRTENQELKSLLSSASAGTDPSALIAPIISYGQPYISKGKNEGIKEGAMVMIAQTLVGQVGKVSAEEAEVVLFSRNENKPVLVKTEKGVTGIIVGDGRRVLMRELPVEAEVSVGERVVTVGQPSVQSGISVGRVQSLEKQPDATTQTAVIDQLVSFYESKIVEVK
jgi:cell shape-determining protein MreC